MSEVTPTTRRAGDVSVGDELPLFELPITSTIIWPVSATRRRMLPVARSDVLASASAPGTTA